MGGAMAHFVVCQIEDQLLVRLQRRAKRHGRSLHQEVREILRDAVRAEGLAWSRGLGSEIASLFRKGGIDADIPELRGQKIRLASSG